MEPIGCPETSVRNYYYLRNDSKRLHFSSERNNKENTVSVAQFWLQFTRCAFPIPDSPFVTKDGGIYLRFKIEWLAVYDLVLQPGDGESTFFRKVSKYTLSQIARCMSRGFFSKFTYLLAYLLTYSMEQSPWGASRFSASQEIPHILWNSRIHNRSHKCPTPVPILSHTQTAHTPTFHFQKIHLNIILPSTSWFTKWSLSPSFPHQNPVYTSPFHRTCYMSRRSHSSRFDQPKNCWWRVQIS